MVLSYLLAAVRPPALRLLGLLLRLCRLLSYLGVRPLPKEHRHRASLLPPGLHHLSADLLRSVVRGGRQILVQYQPTHHQGGRGLETRQSPMSDRRNLAISCRAFYCRDNRTIFQHQRILNINKIMSLVRRMRGVTVRWCLNRRIWMVFLIKRSSRVTT